jgi:hypothetical protein
MRADRTGIGIGLFFVAAGVLFLLEGLDVFTVRAAWLWPLLLIGFGLALLAGGFRRPAPAPPSDTRAPDRTVAEEQPPPETVDRTEDEGDRGEPRP